MDGDTIKVSKIINNKIENKEYTIRMIGVDTPETVDPRKIVQCFGKEASNWTKNKLFDKVIKLEYDESQGERDKYNRLLAYVILDGVNFNKGLIENGYGYEYTYKKSDPYKYQKEFKEAEKYARENKIGL
ncbi:MAG: thermonuclease family protein [Cyanobium sp. MAG06]|nr:thermonuclease family protein [Cyanobium sp. MAG06]